jgi:hypothetical protein
LSIDDRIKVTNSNIGGIYIRNIVFVFLFLLILVACNPKLDDNVRLATEYLEDKGYSIESYKEKSTYTLYRESLIHDVSTWAVQSEKPDPYIGEEIARLKFTVRNHPLSEFYSSQEGFTDIVQVEVLISKDEVIGGTSVPVGKDLSTPPYSLDGKLPREVLEKNYTDWYKEWLEKYGGKRS